MSLHLGGGVGNVYSVEDDVCVLRLKGAGCHEAAVAAATAAAAVVVVPQVMLEPQRVLLVLAQRVLIPSLQQRKNISYL